MALFHKRPLCAACICFIFSILSGLILPVYLTLATLLLAAFLFGFFLYRYLKKGKRYFLLYAMLLSLGVLLGAARSGVFTLQASRLTQSIDETVTAELEVLEIKSAGVYSTKALVSVRRVDEKNCAARAILVSDTALPLLVGDRLSCQLSVVSLDHGSYQKGEQYRYRAEGAAVKLLPTDATEINYTDNAQVSSFSFLEKINLRLQATVSTHVDGEAGKLVCAMLLGARDGISDDTARDFQRAGVSHLLALSGLHIGILTLFCDRLLFFCCVDKKYRIAVTVVLVLFYLILTGCSLSMLRAVLMMLTVYLAFFLRKNADPLTSLFLAGALILLVHPYAVFSTSYQMTVLATFGILAFLSLFEKLTALLPKKRGWRGIFSWPARAMLSSIAVTLCATVGTLPVQWLTFGEISLIAPIANLVLIPLTTILLLGGLGVMLLYPVAPFALLCKAVGGAMLTVADRLANGEVMLSLRYGFVPFIFIPTFLCLAAFLVMDLKNRKWLVPLPMGVLVVAVAVSFAVMRAASMGEVQALYCHEGRNESIAMIGNEGTVLCDISSGSTTALLEGWRLLQAAGGTELDVLMLVHYHSAQNASLARFTDQVTVRALWLPLPKTEKDIEIFATLAAVALDRNIKVTAYSFDTALTVFETGTLTVGTPLYIDRSSEPLLTLTLTVGESTLYYESAALGEALDKTPASLDADFCILGAHGPVAHEPISLSCPSDTAVLIPNEEILLLLELRDDLLYLYGTEKYRFLLQ